MPLESRVQSRYRRYYYVYEQLLRTSYTPAPSAYRSYIDIALVSAHRDSTAPRRRAPCRACKVQYACVRVEAWATLDPSVDHTDRSHTSTCRARRQRDSVARHGHAKCAAACTYGHTLRSHSIASLPPIAGSSHEHWRERVGSRERERDGRTDGERERGRASGWERETSSQQREGGACSRQ